MLSCSPSLLEFAHRQPAGSANSHSRRSTRKTAAFRAGRTSVKAGLYSGCSDPRSKLAQGTTNHLYSVAAITNTTGQVVERYSYNAYGVRTVKNPANVVIAKSVVGNDRGFTSYKLDGETGLYAARARMYSGKLGRFASRDPSGYVDGFSNYGSYFVPNSLDPSGEICLGYWASGPVITPKPVGLESISITPSMSPFGAAFSTIKISATVLFEVAISGSIKCVCVCPSNDFVIPFSGSANIPVPFSKTLSAADVGIGGWGKLLKLALQGEKLLNDPSALNILMQVVDLGPELKTAITAVEYTAKIMPSVVCNVSSPR